MVIYFLFQGLPSIDQLENPDTAIATEVRSRDGVVLDKYFTETVLGCDDISPHVIDALVATEDHRFSITGEWIWYELLLYPTI